MSAATMLAAARRREESTMQSRCKITREELEETNTGVIDLTDQDPSDDLVWEGPCSLVSNSTAVFERSVEGVDLAVQQLVLKLPIRAAGVRVGDDAEIIDGGPDETLAGEHFRISDVPFRTRATARRFPVEHRGRA